MIDFIGNPTTIKIKSEFVEYLRTISVQHVGQISVFLGTSTKENIKTVTGLYIPVQHANDFHDIIEPLELNLLGTKYQGICFCGSKVKTVVNKDDLLFAQKSFYGVNRFVIMKATSSGEIYAAIVDRDYVIYGVPVETVYPHTKDIEALVKEALSKAVDLWTYNEHGSMDSIRDDYKSPELITENKGWRDVV